MAQIFLCHASEDTAQVDEIYDRLRNLGFEPWMDKRDLLPGQRWRQLIPQVLRDSDFVLVFLSQNSVSKRGYVQREFKLTLEILEELPEDTIHTIPVRLDDCQVPSFFGDLHWANLFEPGGFELLIQAMRYSLEQRAPHTPAGEVTEPTIQDESQVTRLLHQEITLREEQAAAVPDPAAQAPETPVSSSPQPGKSSDDNAVATRRTMLWSAVIGAVAVVIAAVIGLYKLPSTPETTKSPTEATRSESQRPGTSTPSSPEAPPEISNSIGMEFVLIPAGTFTMGSPDSDPNAHNDEKPAHQVTISEPFYMGKYEVTQAQWEAVMGGNPSRFKAKPDHPVENVSWDEVQTFIEKLNAKGDGVLCRLPTEAQWEYAARAGQQYAYSFGDDAAKLGKYAWYGNNSGDSTHPVGQKQPNAWGLYDMHGNVWEWVQDWYGPYAAEAVTDPSGPDAGALGVIRGGSWSSTARLARSAYRNWLHPGDRRDDLGFRCLSSAPSK